MNGNFMKTKPKLLQLSSTCVTFDFKIKKRHQKITNKSESNGFIESLLLNYYCIPLSPTIKLLSLHFDSHGNDASLIIKDYSKNGS